MSVKDRATSFDMCFKASYRMREGLGSLRVYPVMGQSSVRRPPCESTRTEVENQGKVATARLVSNNEQTDGKLVERMQRTSGQRRGKCQ